MFNFLISGKQKQARALLANRVNKKTFCDVQGTDRIATRAPMMSAVLAVPRDGRKWEFDEAFPVLTADVSAGGVCLLHHEPLEGQYVLQLDDDSGRTCVQFSVQHVQELGFGYWRIGLEAERIYHPTVSEERQLEERREIFREYAEQQKRIREAE